MKRIFDHPKPCINCGKPAKKKTEWYYDINEPYRGNLKVIRDRSFTNSLGETRNDLILWDGESYYHYCGHFCTNRCAQDFANAIVDGKERWR